MKKNHELVTSGFAELVKALAPYITRELRIVYKANWWTDAVLNRFRDEQKKNLPETGEQEDLISSLDIMLCLYLFNIHWNDVFKRKLSIDHRTWANELVGVRHKWAHIGSNDFDDEYTWRALDTMSRLCEQIDADHTENIRAILRQARYGSTNGSANTTTISSANTYSKSSGILQETPMQGLPTWRNVIHPHPDVAQGRYKNAEFAADLSQVARGEGAFEYQDPVEFFGRTFITEGMSGLLIQALKRVTGQDGEPVIQLKTAFGGGKTHSMLALYHLLRGQISIDKIPGIKPVMEAANISSLPKTHVAVLVGTALDPSKNKRPNNFPGITINTLWGEIAAQLAASVGNLKLYDYVKEADKKGVSPGSETLKNLFDACGSCMVLIDELVAYAKKLHGVEGLPAGSFDNLISFIQEITEAARASKSSLVVASIPESEFEVGGEAGQIALATIEHTFGRMESVWKPVAANEGFEVVRRRLFLNCKDIASKDQVCSQFSQMYMENISDFPIETKELEYKQRLLSCYPIHPEIFNRLYEDWATLETFQKTRGVLRLMAAVVHDLWMNNDSSLLIMPGSISMDNPNVRDELTRYLPEQWNAIVDAEVDGKNSEPYRQDEKSQRFGKYLAARRVARTIFLGSAPSVKQQTVRGIEDSGIRLGVLQPGENISIFNDALGALQNTLTYLYANPSNNRFWFDTRPTLRKTVADRATQISLSEVEREIESRINKIKSVLPFAGVHKNSSSSLDVPDEKAVRLVILKPSDSYKKATETSAALDKAKDILNNRGTSPRLYSNMLAFVSTDTDVMSALQDAVRLYLAWQSIQKDSVDLNLDAAQNRETVDNLRRSNETVDIRIKEAYCWLLVPYIDKDIDIKTIQWESIRISGGNNDIVQKAANAMRQTEYLITQWAPALLLMELDRVLWKDSNYISVKQLWDYLCTYCYLPRLSSFEVLKETIQAGVNSAEYFALAEGFNDGRFLELKFNQYVGHIDDHAILVKLAETKKQIETDNRKVADTSVVAEGLGINADSTLIKNIPSMSNKPVPPPVSAQPQNTRFFMSAKVDNTRINRDVNNLADEIIGHLTSLENTDVEIILEVNVKNRDGFTVSTVRTITENCRTLKIDNFGFEE